MSALSIKSQLFDNNVFDMRSQAVSLRRCAPNVSTNVVLAGQTMTDISGMPHCPSNAADPEC